jgi:hypothetical protein
VKLRVGADFGIEQTQAYNLIACAQIRAKMPDVSSMLETRAPRALRQTDFRFASCTRDGSRDQARLCPSACSSLGANRPNSKMATCDQYPGFSTPVENRSGNFVRI